MKELWDNLFNQQTKETKTFNILKESILFKDLTTKELEIVYKIMNPRQFRAGEVIFNQGDTGVGMYIILHGSVNIYLDEVLENQELKRNLITRLEAGDFFGESSLVIDGGQRSATVIAKEDSDLLGFFYPDLKETIQKYPVTGTKILFRLGEVLGTRLRETNKKIVSLITEVDNLKLNPSGKERLSDGNQKQSYST